MKREPKVAKELVKRQIHRVTKYPDRAAPDISEYYLAIMMGVI